MPEGMKGSPLPGLHESPLSVSFRQAWQDWLAVWETLEKDDDSDGQLIFRTVEAADRITRGLWRRAFAGVGDSSGVQVKATVYAFVALLDETLLFTPWAGQAAWQEKPLEARLYGSRNAGERLPVAMKKVLDERAPASRDLANVYLQCLILGFHGRLRGGRGQAIHEKWRHALFTFAWQRDPSHADVAETLEAPARVTPLRLPVRRVLPDGVRLGLAILGGVLLLSAGGHLFWRDITQELEPVLHLASPARVEQGS
ncbi:DotU family type IV/VI secretion system protein [Phytopseudomonas dryadis]|uniref:Type VI secretion system protein ImpK n=1 Tax=Phytopseudomonas dryadis TaxID=2487520 RepID=A0A4Q9R5L3_9GAMM|nr:MULTISPECIES: DotU/TssL family secretion system protein [Pseudomonas]TBU95643.1 type VI secretion system protein ImpK [Pseudomonas dryadis]TBV06680.1 type VI secretion system protein ImpK [Pseudomonas dryadis]TBV18516.1 type VI secretion system protein ImpK [Pseudomonas sp. FRB 230]